MRVADWVRELGEVDAAKDLLSRHDGVAWHGVAAEARPFFLASIYRRQPRQTVIVAANYDRCLAWQAKLALCGISESEIFQLPSGTSTLFEDAAPEFVALSDRIGALQALISGHPCIVIGAASAVLERTLPKEVLADAFIEVRPKDTLDSDRFLKQLAMLGYQNQEPVRLPGQFSRRGGIIDVYVSGYDLPIRIELFGDEVESMRTFDPMSQRSVGIVSALGLSPSRETLFPLDGGENWGSEVADLLLQTMHRESSMLAEDASARLEELVSADARALTDHVYFDRLDLYRPFLHPDSGCAIDLLNEDGWMVLDEPLEIESIAARSEEELAQSLDARHSRGEILHATAGDYMLPPEHLANHRATLAMSAMNALPDWLNLPVVDVGAVSLAPYRGLG